MFLVDSTECWTMFLCGNDIIILLQMTCSIYTKLLQHCGIYTLKEIVELTFSEQHLKRNMYILLISNNICWSYIRWFYHWSSNDTMFIYTNNKLVCICCFEDIIQINGSCCIRNIFHVQNIFKIFLKLWYLYQI